MYERVLRLIYGTLLIKYIKKKLLVSFYLLGGYVNAISTLVYGFLIFVIVTGQSLGHLTNVVT